ncbi:MAG: PDGLE domain-containing protein [Halodesulfurarchaeum sp.]
MNAVSTDPWFRRAVVGVLVLVILTPVFGWAAGVVGYAEPLDHAAEATGATDAATQLVTGPLPGYTVPGLGSPAGTLLAAVIGTALTFAAAGGIGRLLQR